MRRAVAVPVVLAAGLLLAGCHTPGGVVTRDYTVEFQTSNSAAAQKVVIATCGHLPGIVDSPVQSSDPNVILDYSRATVPQEETALACLNALQMSRPDLQIRAVVNNAGTDT